MRVEPSGVRNRPPSRRRVERCFSAQLERTVLAELRARRICLENWLALVERQVARERRAMRVQARAS